MLRSRIVRPILAGVCCLALLPVLRAQSPLFGPPGGQESQGSVERTARASPATPLPHLGSENPLRRPIEMATASLNQLAGVRDYSYVFVKRERCDGRMAEFDAIYMKIRKQPFSVYVHTLGPVQPRGQEGIYVEGRHENKALIHLVGFRHKLVGILHLDPNGPEMMMGNRYPITTAGFEKLLEKVVQMYRDESKQPESQVQFFSGAKVDGRSCLCVEVSHPVRKPEFFFQMTRIFYDDELNVPIRWEAYDWPTQPGAQPQLGEEYTFRDVRLNIGLTDADFDTENSQYGFK